jgi:3-phenylpropionate/trans-cinnamate dioxygenase ferredoxin reductase subunit
MTKGVVIAGAGHAGGTVAAMLRQFGYAGRIVMVGDESYLPYQRPPLSKAWLKGEADADALALRPSDFYAARNIEVRCDTAVTVIDRAAREVRLSDETSLGYEHLVLATGARAIVPALDGMDLAGVGFLRGIDDAARLKNEIGPGKTLAIVGGGYIGLEVAASARALGAAVILFEREPRLLARVASEVLSTFFQDYHVRRGVSFELGCSVAAIEGQGGRVSGVRLADGRLVACDAIVVGVGAIPNDALARAAGLECDCGIVVDLDARSPGDPAIFAIGDVTRRPMPIYGGMTRLESVPNALEQARQAASALTGQPRPPGECPWQWSDQYDIKLQIAGFAHDADATQLRGDPAAAKFAIFHMKGDYVLSVEAVNAGAEFMMGKQLILNRTRVDRTRLADMSCSMKEVAMLEQVRS